MIKIKRKKKVKSLMKTKVKHFNKVLKNNKVIKKNIISLKMINGDHLYIMLSGSKEKCHLKRLELILEKMSNLLMRSH